MKYDKYKKNISPVFKHDHTGLVRYHFEALILGNVASSSLAARASGRGRPQGVDPLAAQVLDSFFKICILSRTCLVFLDYDRNIINIGPIFILRTRTTHVAGEEIPLQPIPYEVFK